MAVSINVRSKLHAFHKRCNLYHAHVPGLRRIPFPALAIIAILIVVNAAVWAIVAIVLGIREGTGSLLGTAVIAWSLGLRHALDADHISAIDLMTRRLIATGQRPVTVGTFFSLGHSTIVIITSIAVAATAASVSTHFSAYSRVGGIIGTSVSASFLLVLGVANGYILYKLVQTLRAYIYRPNVARESGAGDNVEGAGFEIQGRGCLFGLLRWAFRIVDRPWKMYPLGVLFGLGFDTSSEIALLGISSIEASKGVSIWIILVFPVLFTAGMCLLDTIDGALMLTLYTSTANPVSSSANSADKDGVAVADARVTSPLLFLYTTTLLTILTVWVAITIGTLQFLQLALNIKFPDGLEEGDRGFWYGVQNAGDHYDFIGAGVCGGFVIVGLVGLAGWGRFERWVERQRAQATLAHEGVNEEIELNITEKKGAVEDCAQEIV